MSVNKITEKSVAASIKDTSHVLITQPETVDGQSIETLERAGLSAFVSKLANTGEIADMRSDADYLEQVERQSMIPYAANGSASGGGLTVVQTGNSVKVNGESTATSSQATTKILLSDHVACWRDSSTPSGDLVYNIDLITGHTYRLSASVISGTRSVSSGTGNIFVKAVKQGGTDVASLTLGSSDTSATKDFVYDGTKLHVRALVARGMTCTDLVLEITLIDVTMQNAVDDKADKYIPFVLDWDEFATDDYSLGWQTGYYNTTGSTGSSSDAIRTTKGKYYTAQPSDKKITFSTPSETYCAIIQWDASGDNGTRIGDFDSGSNTQTVTVTPGYRYAFCVGDFSGSAADKLTAEYLATCVATVYKDNTLMQIEQDQRLDALEMGEAPYPDYYDSYLQTKLDTITARQNSMNKLQDAFWFITDYHHQYNEGHSLAMIKYLADRTGIRKMFYGGDAGGSLGTSASQVYHRIQKSAQAWADMAGCVDEFYGVIGNHEWIKSDTSTLGGMMGAYLGRYATKISGMDAVSGAYYVDNIAQKIRYFFIQDTGAAYPVDGSLAWLYARLIEIPADYSVALIVHHGWIPSSATYDEYDGVEITYNYTSIKGLSRLLAGCRDKTSVTINDHTYDFTSLTGDRHIIGVFCGHYHHGFLYTESEETGVENIAVFRGSTDCLSAASIAVNGHPWYWEDGTVGGTKIERLPGTTDEQCFYCVQVDMYAKMLYITAIGGDHDWSGCYEPSGT